MKKILLICATALLAAFNTNAGPTEASGSTPMALPLVIYSGTTNLAYPVLIPVTKQKDVAFQFTSTSLAVPGCTNLYFLQPSVDGINFDTNAADLILVSNAVTGIGPSTQVVKLQNSAVNYYRIATVQASGTSSNNAANYSTKIGFP